MAVWNLYFVNLGHVNLGHAASAAACSAAAGAKAARASEGHQKEAVRVVGRRRWVGLAVAATAAGTEAPVTAEVNVALATLGMMAETARAVARAAAARAVMVAEGSPFGVRARRRGWASALRAGERLTTLTSPPLDQNVRARAPPRALPASHLTDGRRMAAKAPRGAMEIL